MEAPASYCVDTDGLEMATVRLLFLSYLLGCHPVIEEPNKPHYLFLRCRLASQCDASLKYMADTLNCKFIAGGMDRGIIVRTYECTRK